MPFIRKFRTGSGATGVQVCWKRGGEVVRTVHVGSANSELALKKLLRRAEQIKLGEGQSAMFDLGAFEAAEAEVDTADETI
ncbi:MAG: hypothetical protein LBT19_01910 [Candidatus Nomurabacteria bacterium]|jgi:hypothetical protein|nr:hypothetical protein [Candidatus Nomurabacteria bacterium]